MTVAPESEPPLTSGQVCEWHGYLLDEQLTADEPESAMRLIELGQIPDPDGFANLVEQERQAVEDGKRHEELRSHEAFEAVLQLGETQRLELQRRLHRLADEADSLAGRREHWMDDALSDVRSGRAASWRARGEKIRELIEQGKGPVERLGALTKVELPTADMGSLVTLAKGLRDHLENGGKIKVMPDGRPKIGALTPKPVKFSAPLFETVRVNGVPPVTVDPLDAVLTWAEAFTILSALDSAWPNTVEIPDEDTLHERLQWHDTELQQLRRILGLAEQLQAEEQHLAELSLPAPDWNNLNAVRTYARLVDAATAQDRWVAAKEPLLQLEERISEAARWDDAAPCVSRLRDAVANRDHNEYASAHARIGRLRLVRATVQRRDELAAVLDGGAPGLRKAIAENPGDAGWSHRLTNFTEAWSWASTAAWIVAQEAKDVNALQAQLNEIEQEIHRQVEQLAARRAWDHAASPERLGGTARADLTQYADLVRRGGKLTGKFAAQRKSEIRRSMDRCRPSVPAWIMPIHRIADQLRIQPDMFDVVIVDEASQAGLEATFLQYLAPKIVVIGDDKQVSPAGVGIDQQQYRDLAAQYLTHDRYRDSWQDPLRSLFDEAKMRYGGMITLTEHRRCVPEIIGFSNRVAYEPDNIRLIPVRQYGADRLQPIVPRYLPDGYVRGTTHKVNPVEMDAIVEQVERCLADSAYDNKTFGVISLLGTAQAKAIQTKLMERIPSHEWGARDLRVGDAAAFQGSERDVIFLSMVEAAEPGRRVVPLTRDIYVQRFNVAASRAKDQLWVFHSLDKDTLTNPEDMRFQLLDYCYKVVQRVDLDNETGSSELVPEDRVVPPFDSLFEQRVYNRVVDQGYTVIPQYEASGYRIDMVVVGGSTRLAIECDGDHWHGPEAYESDLARQRDLERCGWQFFRVRESAFYVDPAAALHDLWELLRSLDIRSAAERTATAQNVGQASEAESSSAPQAEVDVAETSEPPVEAEATEAHEATTSAQEPSAPPLPPGVIAVGPRSLARLEQEMQLVEQWLSRAKEANAAADSSGRTAMIRDRRQREERMAARLAYLRDVLAKAHVAASSQLPDESWPGSIVRYRDIESGETFEAVVSDVDLGDAEHEWVRPNSPLGKLLVRVQPGQRLSHSKPNGDPAVIEILAVFD
ncbi:hypothetical protein G1H10_26820 [Phytoactinopolyspora halotolerans]|uniref:Uncharacterized protein n=1 Tax=Phytoactinopolyspora halotolerans TaxID=1981512 RepID=A0A6L9SF93_9ACTN|nr:hypothetical protein [Phytoactinopolyspora halotolerans]